MKGLYKDFFRRVISVGLAMGLTFSSVAVAADDSAKDVTKEETVYVFTDASGNQTKMLVTDKLVGVNGSGQLKDNSGLSDIENLKGDETFETGVDGDITWSAEGQDIYYQGTTEKASPISVKITYTLDGQEIAPADLAGKSGKVKIRLDYTNTEKVEQEINGKKESVAVPFTVLSGLLFKDGCAKNVTVNTGKVVDEGDTTIVVGMAFPGMNDSLKLATLKDLDLSEKSIPDYVEVTLDATNFQLAMNMSIVLDDALDDLDLDKTKETYDEMESEIAELGDAGEQLEEGTSELDSGIQELQDNMPDLKDGTGKLKDGISEYTDGVSQVKDGTDQLSDGSKKLVDGTGRLVSGTASAKTGAKQLDDGAKKLSSGAETLVNGTRELSAGAGKLSTGATAASTGAGKLSTGASALDNGVAKVLAGATAATTGAGKLSAGADTLDQNFDTLSGKVAKGFNDIKSGADEIAAGASQAAALLEQKKKAMVDGVPAMGVQSLDDSKTELTKGLDEGISGLTKLQAVLDSSNENGTLGKGVESSQKAVETALALLNATDAAKKTSVTNGTNVAQMQKTEEAKNKLISDDAWSKLLGTSMVNAGAEETSALDGAADAAVSAADEAVENAQNAGSAEMSSAEGNASSGSQSADSAISSANNALSDLSSTLDTYAGMATGKTDNPVTKAAISAAKSLGEGKLSAIQEQVNAADSAVSSLEQAYNDAKAANSQLQQSNDELTQSVADLKAQLEAYQKENAELRSQNAGLSETVQNVENMDMASLLTTSMEATGTSQEAQIASVLQSGTDAEKIATAIQLLTGADGGLKTIDGALQTTVMGEDGKPKSVAVKDQVTTAISSLQEMKQKLIGTDDTSKKTSMFGKVEAFMAQVGTSGADFDPENPTLIGTFEQLAKGAKDISDGITENMAEQDPKTAAKDYNLNSGLKAYSAGLGDLKKGASELANGASTLATGVGTLKDGSSQVASGAAELKSGNEQLASGASELKSGAGKLNAGAGQLATGSKTLANGTSQLKSGADQLNSGAAQLQDGQTQLNTGINKLSNGVNQLNDNSGKLNDGAQQLVDGADKLADGVDQLKDGSTKLYDGMKEFNEKGIQKLTDLYENDVKTLIDRLDAVVKAGQAYDSFSGLAGGMNGEVKFILRADAITGSDEE